jgi:hypothetical protein
MWCDTKLNQIVWIYSHVTPSTFLYLYIIFSGHKLAGVVCDDESNELKPSTVVNCLDIDQGMYTNSRFVHWMISKWNS